MKILFQLTNNHEEDGVTELPSDVDRTLLPELVRRTRLALGYMDRALLETEANEGGVVALNGTLYIKAPVVGQYEASRLQVEAEPHEIKDVLFALYTENESFRDLEVFYEVTGELRCYH